MLISEIGTSVLLTIIQQITNSSKSIALGAKC